MLFDLNILRFDGRLVDSVFAIFMAILDAIKDLLPRLTYAIDICNFARIQIVARHLKFEDVTFYNPMHITTIYMISRTV